MAARVVALREVLMNNGSDPCAKRDESTSDTNSAVVEFVLPLQVWKKCGQDGKPDVYTIGIWQGMVLLPRSIDPVLKAICHHEALEKAQAAIAQYLQSAVPRHTSSAASEKIEYYG